MQRWRFGDFVLDLDSRAVLRDGHSLSLSPKAFQLLATLIENRPRAMSKAELQDRLWPSTFVVEKNLVNLIAEIREALDDDAGHPRFIRTVPRFGYAFSAGEISDNVAIRHNLPEQLTSFVGREHEAADLVARLASTRLLTLTGAGGCGKTRLAIDVGLRVIDSFRDGVWLVDLAPLSDHSLVSQAVASVLDVRQAPPRTLLDSVCEYSRHRRFLLILDNCEHVVTASASVADAMLRAGREVSILATSREALGVSGEAIWRVPSLSSAAAVQLFADRAQAVQPTFSVTSANERIIEDVCHRLDGIPLAIELAAGRLKALSLGEINLRLNDRFRLLTNGNRAALPRQRTLEATVDWSYELLSDGERRLLRRLSVFAGRWTIAAAERVCGGHGLERGEIFDLVSHLVDKSLANIEIDQDGGANYRFLETVRQYARDQLLRSGEADRIRNAHLAFFLDMVLRAEPELKKADQLWWLRRLQVEHDNIRSALDWSVHTPDGAADGLTLAGALSLFWLKRGYFAEGQHWLERALAANPNGRTASRARALSALGNMMFFQGEFERAQRVLADAAALGRTVGDAFTTTFALGIASIAALERGLIEEAKRLAAESCQEAQAKGESWAEGPALACLAYIAMQEGDLESAGRIHERILELERSQGDRWALTIVLYDLALLRIVQHRFDEAKALAVEGIAVCEQFGDRRGTAWCLGALAGAEAADSHYLRAARLRGAMDNLLETVGAPVQPTYERWIGDRYFGAVREALGEDGYRTALDEGRTMSIAEAIHFALEESV